jgi:flavin-dependent dehydrogenase
MPPTVSHRFDVLVIGSGLAATAAARAAAIAGSSVAFVPGIARSRSLEQDGGIVDDGLVADALGGGAPLGPVVHRVQRFNASSLDDEPVLEPPEAMPPRRAFRRLELERWAQEQAVACGAVFLNDLIEGHVLPGLYGAALLTEEHGTRVISADLIVMCEGADPRIPMRVGLRPDYLPEDQVHFARTIVRGIGDGRTWRRGRVRTSWGMPIGVDIIPLGDDAIVSASARIENVMRAERSSRDALEDVLVSPMARALGIDGERGGTGMELVAMRQDANVSHLTHDRQVLGLDAAGIIDPREPSRADATLRSGIAVGGWLTGAMVEPWDTVAAPLLREIRATGAGWRDDRTTGYIEEVAGSGSLAHAARSIIGRFRRREPGR